MLIILRKQLPSINMKSRKLVKHRSQVCFLVNTGHKSPYLFMLPLLVLYLPGQVRGPVSVCAPLCGGMTVSCTLCPGKCPHCPHNTTVHRGPPTLCAHPRWSPHRNPQIKGHPGIRADGIITDLQL